MLSSSFTAIPTEATHVQGAGLLPDKLVGFDTSDRRARPFKLLRTQVARFAAAGARRIGITSATPDVGKTFVASNLAAALSRLPDIQTFLFDLDLRRGSVAEAFGFEPKQGMTQMLLGQTELAAIPWRVEGQSLLIFPTPGEAVASSELLAAQTCARLLEAMASHSGQAVFICDLPPAFASDDAMIACEALDGYLMVVEDGATTAKQVEDSIRLLGRDKLLGTVLNRYVRGLGGDDYGYGYGRVGEKKYSKYYD